MGRKKKATMRWLFLGVTRHLFNKAGYTAIRCVPAGTDSSFGQKRHFCMVSTRL